MDKCLAVVVDSDYYLPAMLSLTMDDTFDPETGALEFADASSPFKLGAEIEVLFETPPAADGSDPTLESVFLGEVTALEPEFTDSNQVNLQIRAYDKLHRLQRSKKTRTFLDQSDNDIVKTIGGEYGLTVEAKGSAGNTKYPYLIQLNQTDFEFLWSRAELIGYRLYVKDKKLHFAEAFSPGTDQIEKNWPEHLVSFQPRATLAHQVSKAVVTGWDPKTKAQVRAEVTASTISNNIVNASPQKTELGAAGVKKAFGETETVVVTQPGLTIDQAKAIAQARLNAAQSETFQAEGALRDGDPKLLAGAKCNIDGVGEKFTGMYYVTSARHVYNARQTGQYRVYFSATGRLPSTVKGLLQENGNGNGYGYGGSSGQLSGVVTAVVTDINDPDKLGKVKVKYPWLPKYNSAELSSHWVRVSSPMGGAERGMFFMPEVDDEVLVAFEHGNPNAPYIVGMLWNDKDKIPASTAEAIASGKVNQRFIRSKSGHLIVFDDTDGKEKITIRDKTEKNLIEIDSKANTLLIQAEKDITLEAKGKLTLKSTGDFIVDSKANINMKCAQNLTAEASANGKIKGGANLDLEAGANGTLKANANAEVSGNAQATLKGSAMAQIQGGLVKIN
jgi:Rhs element Vgr protein